MKYSENVTNHNGRDVKLWISTIVLLALFNVKFVVISCIFFPCILWDFNIIGLGLELIKNCKICGTQDWFTSGLWLATLTSFHVRSTQGILKVGKSWIKTWVTCYCAHSRVLLDSSCLKLSTVPFFLLYINISFPQVLTLKDKEFHWLETLTLRVVFHCENQTPLFLYTSSFSQFPYPWEEIRSFTFFTILSVDCCWDI